MYIRGGSMNLLIAKWGNSLAVRIPTEYARNAGIKEGDSVQASLTVDGGITIRPSNWKRSAFAAELSAARNLMKAGTSVMTEVRAGERY